MRVTRIVWLALPLWLMAGGGDEAGASKSAAGDVTVNTDASGAVVARVGGGGVTEGS